MRIASLQPSVTLILQALGRLDVLCGYTKYCVESIPTLNGGAVLNDSWSTDPAQLEALQPDLVIASVPYRMESLAALLKAGMPVLALAPHSLADVVKDIRLLASVVSEDPTNLIAAFEDSFAQARQRSAGLVKPLVYCEEWGKPLIHSQLWVAEMVEAAGGRFLGQPGSHTTAEAIAAAQPDVMIFAWCGAGNRVPLDRVVAQRNWQDQPAVRTGRIFCLEDSLFNTPGPNLVQGLHAIAAILHPDAFPPAEGIVNLSSEGTASHAPGNPGFVKGTVSAAP